MRTARELRRQGGLLALAFVPILLFLMIVAPGLFDWRDAREASQRTNCLSNMKEIATAILSYAEENDDAFPVVRVGALPTALGWAARLDPYPESRSGPEWSRVFHDVSDPGLGVSYAMNANLATLPRASSHADATRSLLLFEVGGAPRASDGDLAEALSRSPVGDGTLRGMVDSPDPSFCATYPATGRASNSDLPASATGRHAGRANYAFVDGHAGSSAPAEVSVGANASGPRSPASSSGCARADRPGLDLPCAASAGAWRGHGTFSLR